MKVTQAAQDTLLEAVREAKEGDPRAFEQLVKLTTKVVQRIAYPIVEPCLVEDVVQETYLLVFRHLGGLKEAKAFIVWLSRIALQTSYRLQKNKVKLVSELSGAAKPAGTEQVLNDMVLRQALSRLPKGDRDILILKEMLEFSYPEIADVLQIPSGTVKSRLNKARKLLRERFRSGV